MKASATGGAWDRVRRCHRMARDGLGRGVRPAVRPLDEYNSWIAGDTLFDSPLVTKRATRSPTSCSGAGKINGGGSAAATTAFQTAGNQLFVSGVENGQCFMMRQGSFIADFFPDDIKAQIADGDLSNIDFFQLPSPEGTDTAMLGGGDLVGAFTDSDEVKQVVEYITGKDFVSNGYASQAIFPSPHNDFDTSNYTTEFQRKAQELLAACDAVRLRCIRPDAGRGGLGRRVE